MPPQQGLKVQKQDGSDVGDLLGISNRIPNVVAIMSTSSNEKVDPLQASSNACTASSLTEHKMPPASSIAARHNCAERPNAEMCQKHLIYVIKILQKSFDKWPNSLANFGPLRTSLRHQNREGQPPADYVLMTNRSDAVQSRLPQPKPCPCSHHSGKSPRIRDCHKPATAAGHGSQAGGSVASGYGQCPCARHFEPSPLQSRAPGCCSRPAL